MTQETEKERIYLEALDEINNLAIDVAWILKKLELVQLIAEK